MAKSKYQKKAEELELANEHLVNEVKRLKDTITEQRELYSIHDDTIKDLENQIALQKTRMQKLKTEQREKCNDVARICEEALIESANMSKNGHDNHKLFRLIGRLEGHLRSAIEHAGCKYRVERPEDTIVEHRAPPFRRQHGNVQYTHVNDGAKDAVNRYRG